LPASGSTHSVRPSDAQAVPRRAGHAIASVIVTADEATELEWLRRLQKIHQEIAAMHDQAALLHMRAAEFYEDIGEHQQADEQRHQAQVDRLKAKWEWTEAKDQLRRS
jgi:hypothetical protein